MLSSIQRFYFVFCNVACDCHRVISAGEAVLFPTGTHTYISPLAQLTITGSFTDYHFAGLMASEAVAAMIADDLATKALSEGNGDGMVYKMYKNLPVIEKA